MTTLGYLMIMVSALIIHGAIKGRALGDIPGDLGDMFTAVTQGDYAAMGEAWGRTGEGQTPDAAAPPDPISDPAAAALPAGTPGPGEGKLTANAVKVRRAIIANWPGTTVGGYRSGAGAQDHALGKGLDAMVGTDKAKGDAIAAWAIKLSAPSVVPGVVAHPLIQYVIWQQKIWNVARQSEGWRAMADRGSVTANHGDHVHISVQ